MNPLRVDCINQKAPYWVIQDPEHPNNYYMTSDNGVRFDIDFSYNDAVIPSGAYEIGIANRKHKPSPLDMKLKESIYAIIEEFFEQNNDVMLYLTETGDDKQSFRNRLFIRWFNTYEHHDRYVIRTAEGFLEDQENFMAIILRIDNPRLALAIEEFEETAALLFGQE